MYRLLLCLGAWVYNHDTKGSTNTEEFHKDIGGATALMKIITKYKMVVVNCHQMEPYLLIYC